jgi:phosphoglycolate phosphatase-like HAD superfamily hydrolase
VNLVVFDIDGTLLQTTRVDDACYLRAVEDVFGITEASPDWSEYEHCSDLAIAGELVRRRLGRQCEAADIERLRRRFVELLREAHDEDTALFCETPGASRLVEHLRLTNGWAMALATGGFEESARFKLRCASLACGDVPAAFAEDGPARERIITAARARASAHHGRNDFDRIVSIGDGVWDVRAAAALGLPFIGVGEGQRAERLRAAGAETILSDFSDLATVIARLEQATVPQRNVSV